MYIRSACAFLGTAFLVGSVDAVNWKNVRIGGGGGFIPGIVFNPSEKGLTYARADIGGAYRLNSDDSWTPLMDSANDTTWHNWGVDALATDPVDTARVYAAVGMYTNDWDPRPGSILRSEDKGNSWNESVLPFKVGGNMPGRGIGERLAIDPNSNNILYFGARSGHGLWKSTDFGVTWSNVTSFKWTGTYFQDASSSLTSDPVGIAWITFDSTSGKSGAATPRIFVGVVDVGQSVFKSEDGGQTWAWVSGEPMYGFLPHKGVLDPANKLLYVSYSNGAGPYDGTNGTVNKLNITSGIWTDITPTPLASTSYGYGGFAIDLQNPGTVMVASLNSWWPDGIIFRSKDFGATWSPIWAWNGSSDLNLYYKYDISDAPWLQDNTSTSQYIKRVGWMMEALVIDPFDADHWLYGTGATIYGGRDLTKWDTVHNVTLASMATGIEETAVLGLIVPPGGPALLSAVGDIGGFYHDNLDTPRPQAFHNPTYGSTQDIDYAGNVPSSIVRSGASDTDAQVSTSSNYGVSWNPYSGAPNSIGYGHVAISADADTILLMSSNNGALISKNSATFSAIESLPSGAAIASDKNNNSMFYGSSGGSFYTSSNGGVTFTKTATLGSSTSSSFVKVHPTVAGDVWASTDSGLFHSTDFGTTFTQISTTSQGWAFAFGAPASALAYPTIFGFFTVAGATTLYKSEDKGASWTVISDAGHGFGSSGTNVVAADMAKYGRVYVGTNGRGIYYGDAISSSTSPTPSSSVATSMITSIVSTKATSTTPTTVVVSSTSATAAPTGALAPAYGQCGGSGWTGPTSCVAGWTCSIGNPYYSQCVQG